jgi:hypothetical protein
MVSQKVRMLRCAAAFVTAAYFYVRLIPQDLRALPANFLRNHRNFELFTSSSIKGLQKLLKKKAGEVKRKIKTGPAPAFIQGKGDV